MKTTDRQGRPAVQEHDPGPRARGRLDQLLLIDNVPSLDQDRHSAHRRNPPGTVSGGCRPLALGPPHRNLVSGFWTGSAATSARRWSGPGPAWQASGVKKCHGVETDHGRQRRETSEKPKVNEDRQVTCRETLHLLRRARLVALAVGGFLLPWSALLAVTLPATAQAQHWALAWAGLDAAEAAAALVTAVLLSRGDRRASLPAAAAGTLLLIDAWFDVCTSAAGAGHAMALAEAGCAELPLAVAAWWVAIALTRQTR
jgi:hypothetical protein